MKSLRKHLVLPLLWLWPLACVNAAETPLRSLRVDLPGQEQNLIRTSWPGIVCWFLTATDFAQDGFKQFVDLHETHSGYALLTTSIRHNVEVTQPAVHDQIERAAEYACAHGMQVVMDLDVRLARQAFMQRHPNEMQEIVRLRELTLRPEADASIEIPAITLADHYTSTQRGVRPYETLAARLLRAYSYVSGPRGIEPDTVQDITRRCRITRSDTDGLEVTIRGHATDQIRAACVLAAFTLFTPDVFAPHLIAFERGILRQYADAPLAGACKDEWGFPGRFNPRLDDFWFSTAMAREYKRRRPGRDLARDLLLMFKPHAGLVPERAAAINHYMEMSWQRNAQVETAFYKSIKQVFGPHAMVATHPTWFPDPATKEEVFKNGLHWWAARRDLAQTDETTPFCARTALAKKWHSPIWVNMYYDGKLDSYREDLWRHALGGGRINFHPVWPPSADSPTNRLTTSMLGDRLLAADCRVRLLNFISTAPIDCPVAVVFGHPAALNWAGPGLADVGMSVADALWAAGYYADLIPSSEIAAGHLKLAEDGALQYGPQRYAAMVLYQPEFERPAVARFFRQAAAAGRTALFRVGDWTLDFEGKPFAAAAELPPQMKTLPAAEAAQESIAAVRSKGLTPQTTCTPRRLQFTGSMMPKPSGECHLLDGTVILASGEQDVMGDPIRKTMLLSGRHLTFDAIGIAAARHDRSGRLEALAAGGLKKFESPDLTLELPERADLALWRNSQGQWQGVLQGYTGPLPARLTQLTTNWTRLRVPAPMDR
ncbi:MAG TPA: hypothetical protein P5205_19355 [Candidatus Paceibacterota bacterium]|nr:hypothetical protein [Verrucomicrobiota bacterium]HSA12522.1 hypothetical protein [Candidatus Paceibacterota bacterium]